MSIVAVLLYHDDYLLRGGYLGVDIFFVLSGFLITSLLFEEWRRTGRIDLGAFYKRRALRLFPALGALILVGILFVAVAPRAPQAPSVRRGIAYSLLYVSNWASARDPMFLGTFGHTWSLAIEEQFYLLWPVLFIGLLRVTKGRRGLAFAIGGLALTFAVWRFALSCMGATPWRIYVGTDTRADSLLVGCGTAVAMSLGDLPRWLGGARPTRPLALVAAGGIAWLMFSMPLEWIGYGRGVFLGVAIATATLVVALLSNPTWAPTRLLSLPPVVWVGRLSYSLYLWHYPIFALMRPQRLGLGLVSVTILRMASAFAVAIFSYYFIERPFLRRKRALRLGLEGVRPAAASATGARSTGGEP